MRCLFCTSVRVRRTILSHPEFYTHRKLPSHGSGETLLGLRVRACETQPLWEKSRNIQFLFNKNSIFYPTSSKMTFHRLLLGVVTLYTFQWHPEFHFVSPTLKLLTPLRLWPWFVVFETLPLLSRLRRRRPGADLIVSVTEENRWRSFSNVWKHHITCSTMKKGSCYEKSMDSESNPWMCCFENSIYEYAWWKRLPCILSICFIKALCAVPHTEFDEMSWCFQNSFTYLIGSMGLVYLPTFSHQNQAFLEVNTPVPWFQVSWPSQCTTRAASNGLAVL